MVRSIYTHGSVSSNLHGRDRVGLRLMGGNTATVIVVELRRA